MNDSVRLAPVGVIETTADGRIEQLNEAAASTVGDSRASLRGADIRDAFPKSAAGTLRTVFEEDEPTERSFEEYYPRFDQWLAVDVRVGDRVYVYVRDCSARHETAERVDRLERRLDRVQRIGALVATVLEQVIDASDRIEVGETVCERLGGTDLYRFAWVGERDFPADRLRTVAAAGGAADLRDRIDDSLADEAPVPGRMAVETGETRLVEAIADDETVPGGVRRAAFSHGLRSCLAVPLVHQGTVYGVVSVYSDQEDGFSDQERAGLETLGRVAGFAIKSLRQEDLLVADTVTEVTLSARDGRIPFVRAAREGDCQLSLDGAVPRGDGAVVCYLSPDRVGESVGETLEADDSVVDLRWVRSEEDPLLQVTLDGETPVTKLVSWGATVTAAEYTAESARVVAEAPADENVRRIVEAVDATVTETTLVSKAETTRNAESVEAFRDDLDERLTDRQRAVLRTAYLSEYFASPRESTSEDVAETLDIAGSTMLYHLRRAQRKLAAAFFDTDAAASTDADR